MTDGKYEPVICDLPCAPEDILNLVKCNCKTGRCAPPCKCASQKPPLPCTEMCGCGGDEQQCDNVERTMEEMSDDDSSGDELDL